MDTFSDRTRTIFPFVRKTEKKNLLQKNVVKNTLCFPLSQHLNSSHLDKIGTTNATNHHFGAVSNVWENLSEILIDSPHSIGNRFTGIF